ncbi:MAG: alpha-L-fucosidase [Clostridiales bacterium]|nr:alpha-L-fucosidase [Clostridiales bacterium]
MDNFKPTFESLRTHTYPDWFRDAKFGIWSHWGPQSVPMYGDWYARNMYIEGSPQYLYHLRHYGHPSKFGYKDICKLWKAEKFNPEALMDLYVRAGAKYFVGQAMHHDHFFNYPSKINPMNSRDVGPHKDIIGLWKAAAEKHGLPFGVTEHLGASFSWWRVNKGSDSYGPYKGVPYDGSDPQWRDFYFDNFEHPAENPDELHPWYTPNAKYHAYWKSCMKELIDLYQPDLLYTDGGLPFCLSWSAETADTDYADGLEIVAHLYNTSIKRYGENRAVYTQKDRKVEVYRVGILDIEKSQLAGIQEHPWQTDTCIGNWFYDVRQVYKRADQIIDMVVDIASKNGTMLLNILQRPDGSLDEEAEYVLNELASWFPVCGEGIYGTRPWKTFGEGDTRVTIHGFTEDKTSWASSDVRFTCKGNTVYAFLMGGGQNGTAVLHSFNEGEQVQSVLLLGGGECPFVHEFGVLAVQLPQAMPAPYVNALSITLKE